MLLLLLFLCHCTHYNYSVVLMLYLLLLICLLMFCDSFQNSYGVLQFSGIVVIITLIIYMFYVVAKRTKVSSRFHINNKCYAITDTNVFASLLHMPPPIRTESTFQKQR